MGFRFWAGHGADAGGEIRVAITSTVIGRVCMSEAVDEGVSKWLNV